MCIFYEIQLDTRAIRKASPADLSTIKRMTTGLKAASNKQGMQLHLNCGKARTTRITKIATQITNELYQAATREFTIYPVVLPCKSTKNTISHSSRAVYLARPPTKRKVST